MRLSRLQSLPNSMVSYDLETHRIQPGLITPPVVCGSVAWLEPGPRINGALITKQQALEVFAKYLEDENTILVGANIAFDLAVLAVEFAKRGIDVMPYIFRAFEQERVYDLQQAEALHAIANGHLNKDPRTGGELKNPETGKRGRYSLAICTDLVLGRIDAKSNDEYRERYAELENVPMEEWPPAARDYPVDDAKNAGEVALAQTGHLPKSGTQHNWGNVRQADGKVASVCLDCGSTRFSVPCFSRRPHRNLHEVANQTFSAFCLHLGAAWGFRVDQAAVDIIEKYYLAKRAKLVQPFIDAGVVRVDTDGYHENRSVLKRMVAVAYGASGACSHCNGTGKIPSPAAKPIRCKDCRGRCVPWKAGGGLKAPTVANCATCKNTGLVANPNPSLINCVILDEDGKPKEKTCDGTGLHLDQNIPRSEKEGISYGRDTLIESGDEFLMGYGYYQEDQKILETYVPYLRLGRAMNPITGQWHDIPLILRPNSPLETGRVSYEGCIQLFPRKPGFKDTDKDSEFYGKYIPSLRECIVPRGPTRFNVVDVSDGYVLKPGEQVVA